MLQRQLTFETDGAFYRCDESTVAICNEAITYMVGITKAPRRIRVEFFRMKQDGTVRVQHTGWFQWKIKRGFWHRTRRFATMQTQEQYAINLLGMDGIKTPFYLKIIDLDAKEKLDKAREVCMLGA